MRNGHGEMYWIDGSYYKGGWKNGIQDGIGELYRPNESILKGLFQNNIFVGDDKEIVPYHLDSGHIFKGSKDSTISKFLVSKRNFSTDNENNRTDRSSSSKTKNNSSRYGYVSAKKENNDFKSNQSPMKKIDDISTIIGENKFNTIQENQIDKQKESSQTDFAINKSPK